MSIQWISDFWQIWLFSFALFTQINHWESKEGDAELCQACIFPTSSQKPSVLHFLTRIFSLAFPQHFSDVLLICLESCCRQSMATTLKTTDLPHSPSIFQHLHFCSFFFLSIYTQFFEANILSGQFPYQILFIYSIYAFFKESYLLFRAVHGITFK